ncbi:hypothetical protein KC730_03160 [Candidatus Kaiserbacteria bacterium]|nr:hypothetical protein [Candidatus Kaiserbacteria bacterium]
MLNTAKLLFWFLLLFVLFSASATYYRYYVQQDFLVLAEMDCDPETESCFTWICDPEVDGEEYCTGDLAEDTWYYKDIYRNAKYIPNCDPYDEGCPALECIEEEEYCEIVLCTNEIVEEEELDYECTDPETFEWPDYFDEEEDQSVELEVEETMLESEEETEASYEAREDANEEI